MAKSAFREASSGVGATQRARQPKSVLREIRLDDIDQPRRRVRRFRGDIAALADSMQDYGLQQPITVRADGRYMLTSGIAPGRGRDPCRLLGWTTITGFVRSVSAAQAYVLDLIENP